MKTTESTFAQLNVDKRIVDALAKNGITNPTEIQAATIPKAIEGKDIIGRSITGSGKTLAFSIPIIMELMDKPGRGVKALILAPTRELAKQVDEELRNAAAETSLKTALIYGGVEYEGQFKDLEEADIVVGTPGRVIDHVKRSTLAMENLEFFVLDEADRMLDMGFIDDIRYIINHMPPHKQSFFFSATMPMEARELAESFMHEPTLLKGTEFYVDNSRLEEYYVDTIGSLWKADMCREILKREEPELALIFVNTRRFSDALAEYLEKHDFKVRALHGGHAQNKRERIVEEFEKGELHILVATDVAARGLDIDDVTHVINFEVPNDEQSYTHRIGRTARAGRSGVAITLLEPEEHRMFARIEGDSMRNINKYETDYRPKKEYLLPPPKDGRRGPKRGGPRKGPRRNGGNRRGGPRKGKPRPKDD